MAKTQKYTMFCSNCGSVSHPKCKFSGLTCLFLFICGFWPGLIYYFAVRRDDYCGVCGYYNYLLPINSPVAQRFIQQQQLKDRIERG